MTVSHRHHRCRCMADGSRAPYVQLTLGHCSLRSVVGLVKGANCSMKPEPFNVSGVMNTVDRLSRISRMEWWNGTLEWNTGINN